MNSAVWDRICRHLDGLGIGSTVAALHNKGVLAWLRDHPNTPTRKIADRFGGNPGYINVALRLLASQGWLTLDRTEDAEELTCTMTADGVAAIAMAPLYGQAVSRLSSLRRFQISPMEHEAQLSDARRCLRDHWGMLANQLSPKMRWQIAGHLDGHVVGPIMSVLAHTPIFEMRSKLPAVIDLRDPGFGIPPVAFEILETEGWVAIKDGQAQLTSEGLYAAACAKQYWYPVAYLETLFRVPDLLFGDMSGDRDKEGFVDRALDVRFSGKVFTSTCRTALEGIVLPLFANDADNQLTAVVDTGCGDGSLLATLYGAISDRTRSRDKPLTMVGIEPSSAARRIAELTLRAKEVPHILLDGDITCPQEIKQQLAVYGFDETNTLHISKSVVHNRRYLTPARKPDHDLRSSNVFTLAQGAAIRPGCLEQNLIEHFQSWRPLTRQHGMVIVEAHTAPPASVCGLLGRSIATLVDALHGYSNQYLVEPSVFLSAAERAGYRSKAHADLGQKTAGHVCLTIDHFV